MFEKIESVIFDLETTGLYGKNGDRIIEIGAIKLRSYHITGVFQALINPDMEISSFVTELTGINKNMLAGAPMADEVLPAFVDFVGNDLLVAHNTSFDSAFLKAALDELGIKKEFSYYCTLKNSRQKFKNSSNYKAPPNYKLETLGKFFKFYFPGEMHRALADSVVTAQLYMLLNDIYAPSIQPDFVKEFNSIVEMNPKQAPFLNVVRDIT